MWPYSSPLSDFIFEMVKLPSVPLDFAKGSESKESIWDLIVSKLMHLVYEIEGVSLATSRLMSALHIGIPALRSLALTGYIDKGISQRVATAHQTLRHQISNPVPFVQSVGLMSMSLQHGAS